VYSDSNSKWAEFGAAVTLSNGSSAITPPRHVHVEMESGQLVGRLDLERMTGMEGWQPDRKLLQIIRELRREGRL
jgi:hypothetical protein